MQYLRVLDPARVRALCTLAECKAALSLSGSAEDATLTELIDLVGTAFAGPDAIEREPWRQRYEVTRAGSGSPELLLPVRPVEEGSIEVEIGGTALAATEYSLVGPTPREPDRLWRSSSCWSSSRPSDHVVRCWAGWLMPDQVATWAATTAFALGSFARPSSTALLRYEATVAGTTGDTEPAWPTAAGETLTDGTVTWTARAAFEVPMDLRRAAVYGVVDLYQQEWREAAISSEQTGPIRTDYSITLVQERNSSLVHPRALAVARRYR